MCEMRVAPCTSEWTRWRGAIVAERRRERGCSGEAASETMAPVALVLVSYATRPFRESQRRSAKTALEVGGFDRVRPCGPSDLDRRFRRRNRAILAGARGAGYWLWKPYVVSRALEQLRPGDWLFYADSGSFFVDSVRQLVDFATGRDLDLLVFDAGPFLESAFTKRDAFVLLGCDRREMADTRQRGAGFSLWRRSDAARALAREWLDAARDERLLTDLDNQLGLPNYPDWREHRHDQSIFSLLTKRAGIPAFRDPSQYGERWRAEYPESTYPQIVHLTRSRSAPFDTRLRATVVRRLRDVREGGVTVALSPFPRRVVGEARRRDADTIGG